MTVIQIPDISELPTLLKWSVKSGWVVYFPDTSKAIVWQLINTANRVIGSISFLEEYRLEVCIHTSIYFSHKHIVGWNEQGSVLGTEDNQKKRQTLSPEHILRQLSTGGMTWARYLSVPFLQQSQHNLQSQTDLEHNLGSTRKYLPLVCFWASQLISLRLGSLICKKREW